MELTVGTDSTWSLRVLICCHLANIDVDVNVIDLTQPNYKTQIFKHSVTGLVPSLKVGSLIIHDSLAITEYLNERCHGAIYPGNIEDRALARSLCSELHSGFINLRTQCPFSLGKEVQLKDFNQAITTELSRVEEIFSSAQLPFMFDSASAVDAFFSIIAFRLKTYGIEFDGRAGRYQKSLLDWSYLTQVIDLAISWKSR